MFLVAIANCGPIGLAIAAPATTNDTALLMYFFGTVEPTPKRRREVVAAMVPWKRRAMQRVGKEYYTRRRSVGKLKWRS